MKENEDYEVRIPDRKLPRLKILNIFGEIDLVESDVLKKLKLQNSDIIDEED